MEAITDTEFRQFQAFILDAAGISLAPAKKALVSGRLAKRLRACQLDTYGAYFALVSSKAHGAERQIAIDLLTTNETYFFREPKHFDFLGTVASESRATVFRTWSAACSSGEEAYSMAMVLADRLGIRPFEVIGTDISTRMLQAAQRAHYPDIRARQMPADYRKRFCLRGTGVQEGTLLVERSLRQHVHFAQANLVAPLPDLGRFDVAFLRNVMIYFDPPTKREVVQRVVSMVRPDGYLCIGHSESLHDLGIDLIPVAPSIFRKPGRAGH
ncbi:CheR family methyltransferase [Burkholderia sp. WSM2232]|uniref:CheR family methyltransferase n=1 Tax=Burkholderia sp. WSM2232 TaxID=944436 RepID=UPI0003FA4A4A|nr:protein-glutamate O-methyltransferase CheR [Burkholderia sp. WSM2232]